jgi:hypothetical protein
MRGQFSLRNGLLIAVAGLGLAVFSSTQAHGQVLFDTQEDFANWGDNNSGTDFTINPAATPDSDGSTINGLGNTVSPGGAGTAGSGQVTWMPAAGTYAYFYGPGEQGNAGFLSAIDPGSGGGNLVAYSGTISVDSTTPPPGSGNYFELGLVLNYSGNFGQFFGTASASPNAAGFYTYTIPYTISAVTGLSYFQPGLIYNSNYTGTPFNIDNIRVVPEPASLGLFALGALGFIRRRKA